MRLIKALLLISAAAFLVGFTEPPTIAVTLPTGTARYLDADGAGCSNGSTTYDPATASCGSGSATVYTTLENADGNVGAGNILYMRAGTYTANTWDESGSSGSPILITPYNGETVIVDCVGSEDWRMVGDYPIFDGGASKTLTVTNSDWSTSPNFMLRVMGNYATLRRVRITGPSGYCNRTDNVCINTINTADDNHPTNFYGYNNILTDCSHKGIYLNDCQDCEFSGNIINHTGNNGIQINPHQGNTRITNLTISGNAIYDCGDCYSGGGRDDFDSGAADMPGDGIYSQGTAAGEGYTTVYIYNNLIWDNYQNCIDVAGLSLPTEEMMVYNNTCYLNGSYGLDIDSGGPDNVITLRNNILNDTTGATDLSGVTMVANDNNETSPSFASADDTSANFLKITAANPGYDTNPPVTIDYFGTERSSSTPDIGAHEYAAQPHGHGGGGSMSGSCVIN